MIFNKVGWKARRANKWVQGVMKRREIAAQTILEEQEAKISRR